MCDERVWQLFRETGDPFVYLLYRSSLLKDNEPRRVNDDSGAAAPA